jgi:beta-N-acetylhexosaminidase
MNLSPRPLSRRSFLGTLAGGAAGAIAIACGGGKPASASSTPPPTSGSTPTPVASTPSGVSLDEMIGQMLMVGFQGFQLAADTPIHAAIAAGRLGNVVLFDFDVPTLTPNRNIDSPSQLTMMNQSLQALASRRLLIAADQEGGFVARLRPSRGFPPTHSAQELGERNQPEFTKRYSREQAAMLLSHGINLNLAPVVDVNVNPQNPVIGDIERSFSADVDVVTSQALAFIEGHHEEGVLTTLKHFPGHGSSTADSHLGFVDVTNTWSTNELVPYRRIIDAGKADAVMTAHIFNGKIDPDLPATLSRRTITGILRDEMGFDGVIITDDMQMGAISNYYEFEPAIEAAVNAGADIVAIANNSIYDPNVADRAFNAIKAAVMARRIDERRIEESYERIVALKQRLT